MKTIRLKNYKLIKKIGWGGMGVVYVAEDLALGRLVALKFLSPHLMQDPEIIDRFRSEARSQARLVHPNITMVYSFQESDDQAFLVMEYVDGETLEARLKRQGRLSATETVAVFSKILDAMDYAHSRKVIHRDIKPGNIGFTSDGVVKVMDFGIALNIEEASRLTKTGHSLGTPEYMAPEQILGRQSDQRADIYSLGITLFETLTGHLPFQGDSDYEIRVAQINQAPPSPRSFGYPDITASMEKVILKALAKDQKDRFANAKEFLQALKNSVGPDHQIEVGLAAKLDAATRPFRPMAPPPKPPQKKGRLPGWLAGRSPLIYGASAAAILVVLTVVLYLGFWAGAPRPQVKTVPAPPPAREVVAAAPASAEKRPEPARPVEATASNQASAPAVGANSPSPQAVSAPPPKPLPAMIAPAPEKSQASAALPPKEKAAEKPPINKSPEVVLPAAVKARLTDNGLPDIKVSLNEKNHLIISGRLKNPAQKKRLMQLVGSLGLATPIDYSGLTIVTGKTVTEKHYKKRSRPSQEETPQVPEETRTPLPPKLD